MDRSRLKMGTWRLLLLAALAVAARAQDISCKDETGRDVDWFVVHKFPKLTTFGTPTAPPGVKEGSTYRYLLSTATTPSWTIPSSSIRDRTNMLARTLVQANIARILTIGYNDQPPDGTTGVRVGRAHAKGTLMVNINTGAAVWLIHSVPKFTDIKSLVSSAIYNYPSTGYAKGQSFLCLTLPPGQIDLIGKHLYNMRAHVYDAQPPGLIPSLQQPAPFLYRTVQNDFSTPSAGFSFNVDTSKQLRVRLISKVLAASANDVNDYDLWAQRVAPHLQINMFVQSWQCGQGSPLPNITDSDTGVKTDSLENLQIPWSMERPPADRRWYYSPTRDHSKWGISKQATSPFFCIGDMNRRTTQTVRSGGVACFNNRNAWQAYWNLLVNPNAWTRDKRRPSVPRDMEDVCDEV